MSSACPGTSPPARSTSPRPKTWARPTAPSWGATTPRWQSSWWQPCSSRPPRWRSRRPASQIAREHDGAGANALADLRPERRAARDEREAQPDDVLRVVAARLQHRQLGLIEAHLARARLQVRQLAERGRAVDVDARGADRVRPVRDIGLARAARDARLIDLVRQVVLVDRRDAGEPAGILRAVRRRFRQQ